MADILKIEGLTKKFGGLTAVNNFDMGITDNKIHALIGPNGSGKTTTINMISGVLTSDSGKLIYNGEDINGKTTDEIARMGIVRTFQNIKLFNSLSVLENTMVGGHSFTNMSMIKSLLNGRRHEEQLLEERADEALNYVGLYNVRKENVSNLPYGQQKMLELARAMMCSPKLLLLDEPAAGLNPTERMVLMHMLEKIFAGGVKLFLVEHNMDVVMNLCHCITVLSFGVKIAEGTPSE
ncbi:MAG: ABC transporter ATP-binding protein, partial [Oscillospiraceae bacterium]